MKRILSLLLLAAVLMGVLATTGCNEKSDEKKTENTNAEDELFYVGSWERSDHAYGDTLYFNLRPNGDFSFFCACGEPVGDSDCYDKYEYVEEKKIIRAYSSDDREIFCDYKLRLFGKNFILIEAEDKIMEFWKKDCGFEAPEILDDYTEKIKGYSMYRGMTALEDGALTLVPQYYDGDVAEHRQEKIKMNLSKDAVFETLFVEKLVTKEGETQVKSIENEIIGLENFMLHVDSGSTYGYIWLNEELEIIRILIVGDLIIWE